MQNVNSPPPTERERERERVKVDGSKCSKGAPHGAGRHLYRNTIIASYAMYTSSRGAASINLELGTLEKSHKESYRKLNEGTRTKTSNSISHA